VPVAQGFWLDPRIGDGDAAQPRRKTRQRVKHHAVVVDMRVALHDEPIGEAEMIKERDETLDRRVGRRIAAARLIRKLVGRPEDMRVRVPRARRRLHARAARMRHRSGNARRLIGDFVHLPLNFL
jgi:hypothetical protein